MMHPADGSPILLGLQITCNCIPLSVLLIFLYQGAFIYCGLEKWGGGGEDAECPIAFDRMHGWGEGRNILQTCPQILPFPSLPPGYSNWKLTGSYLYSCREIRRLHKFCVLTFIHLLLFTLLFSQRRRSAEDELMMRHFLAEGDLISVSFDNCIFPELRNILL